MSHAVTVHPIRDEAAYRAAVEEVRRLWGAAAGTAEGDRLDVLLVLVDAYEAERDAVGLPDPIAAIEARMEDLGLSRDDLGAMLGVGSGRVSEVLNRRRRLTLGMIRGLAAGLGLSEACLVQSYELALPGATRRTRRVPDGRPRRAA